MDMDKVIKSAVKHKENQLIGENLVYNRSWEAIENIMDDNESKVKKGLSNIFKKKFTIHFGEAAAILAFILLLIAVPVASRWNDAPTKDIKPADTVNQKLTEGDKSVAMKTANEFVRVLYYVNDDILAKEKHAESIDTSSTQEPILLDEGIHAVIKTLMTEKGFDSLHANRLYQKNLTYAVKRDCTMELKALKLTERENDGKQNELGYDYEAKIKVILNKDKKEVEEFETGYIGLIKENGKWKVNVYNVYTQMKLNVQP